jgi:hypothetical protein
LEGKLAIFRAFGSSSPQIALRRRGRDSKDSFSAPPATQQRLIKDELATIPNRLAKGQGRRKDMIIRGGENIYPRAIENAWPLTRSRVSGGSSTNFRSELYLAEKVPWSVTAMSALGQKQTCAAHKPMSALCQ